jgi:nicotinamidase/pyrazinamidase
MPITAESALLVVDVQNDFCPGGALPVAEGDRLVPRLNAYLRLFRGGGWPVLASRDWHPAQTTHFQEQGGPWPVHCVQGTLGAAFHPDLDLGQGTLIVSKGMRPDEDAYSAFQARDESGKTLHELLRTRGVRRLYIGGLTLDYCVKSSTLDALAAGYAVTVLMDATRAVNVRPHDGELAVEELLRAGAELTTIERLG